MESVPCDLCGSSMSEAVAQQTDRLHRTTDELFTIVRCSRCGLHFTNPRPSPAEIGRYYAATYAFHGTSPRWHRFLDALLDKWANSPAAVIAAFLPAIGRRLALRVRPSIDDPVLAHLRGGRGGPFLDIGCGSGTHAHYWGYSSSLLGCRSMTQVAGVEVSEVARAALVKAGIQCWPGIDAVPDGRVFGLIRMNWSLEHVHSPNAYFAFIASHLRPGGRAVIAVPNYGGLLYRMALDCVELPIHLYHFRPGDIAAYGALHGLQTIQTSTFSYPGMFLTAAEAGLLPNSFGAMRGILAARATHKALAAFDSAGWGNDMVIVLEKPLQQGNPGELA